MPVDEPFRRLSSPNPCGDGSGQPHLTLLDLRTEYHLDTDELENGQPVVLIQTRCPVLYFLLDELQRPEVRAQLPKHGTVVTITETGNRDQFAIQYLSADGLTNIQGLEFGMRAWIKAGSPTETIDPGHRPSTLGKKP